MFFTTTSKPPSNEKKFLNKIEYAKLKLQINSTNSLDKQNDKLSKYSQYSQYNQMNPRSDVDSLFLLIYCTH